MADYFLGDEPLDIGVDLVLDGAQDTTGTAPTAPVAAPIAATTAGAEVEALLEGTGFELAHGGGGGEQAGGLGGLGGFGGDTDMMDQEYNFKLFASQETSQLPASRLALAPGLVNLGSAVRDLVSSQSMQRSLAKRRLRGLPSATGVDGPLQIPQHGDGSQQQQGEPGDHSLEGGHNEPLDGTGTEENGALGGGGGVVPMGGFLGGGRVVNRWVPKKKQQRKWSAEEDLQFYDGLRQFGTSFNLIAVFTERDRDEVVAKFKLEERKNPNAVQEALNNQLPVNVEEYSDRLKLLEAKDARDNARLTDAETLQLLEADGGGAGAAPGDAAGGDPLADVAGGDAGGTKRGKGSKKKRVTINEGLVHNANPSDLPAEFDLLTPMADDTLDNFTLDDEMPPPRADPPLQAKPSPSKQRAPRMTKKVAAQAFRDLMDPTTHLSAEDGKWEDFELDQLDEMPLLKRMRLEDEYKNRTHPSLMEPPVEAKQSPTRARKGASPTKKKKTSPKKKAQGDDVPPSVENNDAQEEVLLPAGEGELLDGGEPLLGGDDLVHEDEGVLGGGGGDDEDY